MTFTPDRRHVLAGTLAASVSGWTRSARAAASVGPMALGNAEPFSFDELKRRAKTLAQTAYTPPPAPPDGHPLRDMTFDTFAQAVYKPEMELWHGVPGAQPVRLFPQGRYYAEPVAIYVLEDGKARQVVYSPDFFNMPRQPSAADIEVCRLCRLPSDEPGRRKRLAGLSRRVLLPRLGPQ